jgi:DNA-binding IclR family transcriptional regulator
VLRTFAEGAPALTMAERTQLPLSGLFRILATLEEDFSA